MIIIHTNFGDISLELDYEKAPKTAANFEQYVTEGFYDGIIFHRVINGFMIQGGGFEPGMVQKQTRETIENEADNGLSNTAGTVAMARTMDPHSASAQFFINVSDNTFLDHTAKTTEGWGYAVFGKIVDGMDVVNKLKTAATTMRAGHQDVPTEDIIIESAELVNADQESSEEAEVESTEE
ncbi:peptidylprolyl isomerase [Neptuniibacter sp. UBA847]|uniref:peptidylprolyl isomerase n=1 Tax=Neptuniibacter sp. UBA847 TaxID=1946977 RepID=UPI000C44AE91|nr:peptidylprolyl isomerase [Neptuniibacter sp. UBA847]MAY42629.1 peptidylprolyl isomerase [Oceanospirillaceae bacterium]|tara:strand:+ start:1432 stop:1974 length:543 start_codon:yes stop_codon:yes gene_type:complete